MSRTDRAIDVLIMPSDLSKHWFSPRQNYIHRPSAGHGKLHTDPGKHFFPFLLPWLNNLPKQTKECPAQLSDAQGFPDTCAPTSIAGQGVGNDCAESRPGELAAPCAALVAELVSGGSESYVCATQQRHPSLGH